MDDTAAASQAPVSYDEAAGVATITLSRPQAMNSLDVATKEALLDALRRAADPAVRCVLLTGTGRAFCVGQDLREHVAALAERSLDEVWATVDQHYSPIVSTLMGLDKPVLAAVNGVAAGAGLSLALACDLRIAADSAAFTTAFTGIGLSCDTGSSWTLQRIVGRARALEMLLLPSSMKADEALRIGLVHSVVPAEDLASESAALAARLAAGPTRAYAAVKRSVDFAATHSLDETLAVESQMMAWTGSSSDHLRAVRSFVAKEAPTFTGS